MIKDLIEMNPIVKLYLKKVKKKEIDLNNVPEKWRDEVKTIIEEETIK